MFNNITGFQGEEKEIKQQELFNNVESDLKFLGITAIEDKLQDGVPESIESLLQNEIRVWVLTGDKKETAFEIGKMCKLVDEKTMTIIDIASNGQITDSSISEFLIKLDKFYESFTDNLLINDKENIKKIFTIIDGTHLSFVLSDEVTTEKFLSIAMISNSLICCRVSPKQKSKIVSLVKKRKSMITLSIGDGANDVPMIMEAHIGIGINGKEGSQAVRSADYSISQFRFLRVLLLIHGRWGYRRISTFICYYFYKNLLTVFTEILFPLYNGFSGQIYFSDILSLLYNAFWTSWPCIFSYSFEKDVDEEISLSNTHLYQAGPANYYFNLKVFWVWFINSITSGLILFYCVEIGLQYSLDQSGLTKGHWVNCLVCFTCIIHVVTYKVFIDSKYWNSLSLIIGFLSLIFYYACMLVVCLPQISKLVNNELVMKIYFIFTNIKILILIIFLPILALLPEIGIKFVTRNYFKAPDDAFIEISIKKQELNKKEFEKKRRILNYDKKLGDEKVKASLEQNYHQTSNGMNLKIKNYTSLR